MIGSRIVDNFFTFGNIGVNVKNMLTKKSVYNQFCKADAVYRSLPPELSQLLFLHNADLDPEFWGVCLKTWLMVPFFPVRMTTFQRALNLDGQRYRFWRIFDELIRRHILRLTYPRKSNYFRAEFVGVPSQLTGDAQTPPSQLTGDAHHRSLPAMVPPTIAAEERSSPTIAAQNRVVVVDFKNNYNNLTPDDVRLAISGSPWDHMMRLVQGFQAGHLIPHFKAAHVFFPSDPVARLRGAIFYLADQHKRGQKSRSVLAVLLKHIEQGNVLEEQPDLLKKGGLNAKSKKEPEPDPGPPQDVSGHTLGQLLYAAGLQARIVPNVTDLLDSLSARYAGNPNWPVAAEKIKIEAQEGRLNFKKSEGVI